jgi:hypothetical protein
MSELPISSRFCRKSFESSINLLWLSSFILLGAYSVFDTSKSVGLATLIIVSNHLPNDLHQLSDRDVIRHQKFAPVQQWKILLPVEAFDHDLSE